MRRAFVLHVIAAFAPTRSVDKRCAQCLGRRRCIHKFIMLSSRTSTEFDLQVFFHETDHLQNFENRNNTN